MYCLYKMQSSTNAQQVLNDVVGILTGSITDVSQCSASCNKSASSILSTTPVDWELYDSAAGAAISGVQSVVIRSQWSDSETNFKHLMVGPSNDGLGIGFIGYENWNPVAHTGSTKMKIDQDAAGSVSNIFGQAAGAISISQAGGHLIISASKSHIFVASYTGSLALGSGISHSWFMLSEYTRDDPWNTVANGYPSWVIVGANSLTNLSSSTYFYAQSSCLPRVYNTETSQDMQSVYSQTQAGTTNNNAFYITPYSVYEKPLYTHVNMGLGAKLSKVAYGPNKGLATFIYPIILVQGTGGNNSTNSNFNGMFLGGNLSSKNDSVFMTKVNRANTLDEVTLGADTFVILNSQAGGTGQQFTFCVKKA